MSRNGGEIRSAVMGAAALLLLLLQLQEDDVHYIQLKGWQSHYLSR